MATSFVTSVANVTSWTNLTSFLTSFLTSSLTSFLTSALTSWTNLTSLANLTSLSLFNFEICCCNFLISSCKSLSTKSFFLSFAFALACLFFNAVSRPFLNCSFNCSFLSSLKTFLCLNFF